MKLRQFLCVVTDNTCHVVRRTLGEALAGSSGTNPLTCVAFLLEAKPPGGVRWLYSGKMGNGI